VTARPAASAGVTVRQKYGNKRVTVDGVTFDSQAEGRRYLVLRELVKAGEITDLEMHPSFRIEVGGVLICRYVADFAYVTRAGVQVIEDVKGVKTAAYRLKRKLMKAVHGIEIQEVTVR
jgi:hypothetical protein